MKTFAFAAVAAILALSSLAQASGAVRTITGKAAEQLMLGMESDRNTQWIENTIGVTTLRLDRQSETIECTLYGSHGGSPMAANPEFVCEIQAK